MKYVFAFIDFVKFMVLFLVTMCVVVAMCAVTIKYVLAPLAIWASP